MDIFNWIFIICIFLLALGFILNAIIPDDKPANRLHSNSGSYEALGYSMPEIPEGYRYHEMVGMYYRGITSNDFGVYDGFALPEQNNRHDPYAVAIYRKSDNKHVGYIPAGNKDLFKTLLYRGGHANAIFRIQGSNQRSYGIVYIEENYKVFRTGEVKTPYLSRTTKLFSFKTYGGREGKIKCWLTTKLAKNEHDYTVTAIDENGTLIGITDDNQLQLYDYVDEKHNMVPACCNVKVDTGEGVLLVPLNYTEKTINRKIEEFIKL